MSQAESSIQLYDTLNTICLVIAILAFLLAIFFLFFKRDRRAFLMWEKITFISSLLSFVFLIGTTIAVIENNHLATVGFVAAIATACGACVSLFIFRKQERTMSSCNEELL